MVEFLLGIWLWAVGIVLWWPIIIPLVLVAIWVEHNDSHGWMAFWAILIHVWLFKFFEIDQTFALYYAAGYVPVGVVWSIYRWKRYVDTFIADRKQWETDLRVVTISGGYANTNFIFNVDEVRECLTLLNNKEKILCWVMGWPISLVESFLGDLVHQLWMFISVRLGGIYKKIVDSAIDKAMIDVDTKKTGT